MKYHKVYETHGKFYSSDLFLRLINVIFMAVFCFVLFTFIVSFLLAFLTFLSYLFFIFVHLAASDEIG